jgi:hypothetical protein
MASTKVAQCNKSTLMVIFFFECIEKLWHPPVNIFNGNMKKLRNREVNKSINGQQGSIQNKMHPQ